ncbi:hypothetical protein A3K29_03595 [Candidatus Collierbacteria bacterium RIFOXYB2_FULL_46_14]|nr:MAG: hypothetical protein A3K29_03595 [Candidatus Collierbacteria bacterium RIFOXYB2_FULL_46_14]OGD76243.1 MAG: hypothetical protein A3K43_03595 [Candidatus Collierbacteria bacterium RIFOXYA2_FULL_46_20]OGD77579.1 MAG: hypothetical protein A3K39_03595 [Candidatus Collierbacteria bacterium RIFOXYC2_FULL_43_15]OGD80869.1 MAG: hypothetical protein A2320_04090 [Pseudomonadales bacterium GWC2_63_15]OGD82301.1 MAG: hypothetical protein A3K36_03595 [Candidatus Collierbacteria bacterium RIFOXYD2_FUL
MIGSQIPFANYGAEFLVNEKGERLMEDGSYAKIFVRSNEGFGGIIHAINDGPDHNQEVIEYCRKTVQDFLASCQNS